MVRGGERERGREGERRTIRESEREGELESDRERGRKRERKRDVKSTHMHIYTGLDIPLSYEHLNILPGGDKEVVLTEMNVGARQDYRRSEVKADGIRRRLHRLVELQSRVMSYPAYSNGMLLHHHVINTELNAPCHWSASICSTGITKHNKCEYCTQGDPPHGRQYFIQTPTTIRTAIAIA
jgi:hypothetical protein